MTNNRIDDYKSQVDIDDLYDLYDEADPGDLTQLYLINLKKKFYARAGMAWGPFEFYDDGVYRRSTTNTFVPDPEHPGLGSLKRTSRREKICSPLSVIGQCRNEESKEWGLVLRWVDPDYRPHTECVPASLLSRHGTDVVEMLAQQGLKIIHGHGAKVKEYLQKVEPTRRFLSVPRTGWQTAPKGLIYVLPKRVIGDGAKDVIFQGESYDPKYRRISAGSLSEWQAKVAAYCVGNHFLVLGASIGFAAPVLHLLNEPSGGFHLRGASSKGKTTAERVAASVFGQNVISWRTTDNALECTAEAHNDSLLAIDELAEVDPEKARSIAYMLANGEGKDRMGSDGKAQRKRTWRLLYLSTGEISLADHAREAGQNVKAGTEVRMIDLDADAGRGMGLFENIHTFEKPSEFSDYLAKDATENFRGVAGPMFIEWLIKNQWATNRLRLLIEKFVRDHVRSDAGGEVHRVARRFAFVGAAGELAREAGITGWPSETALNAAAWCFQQWLSRRSSLGSSDMDKAIEQVRGFLFQHKLSRFQDLDDRDTPRMINRAGFRKTESGKIEYLILPTIFRDEICKGYDSRTVIQELENRRCLRRTNQRAQVQIRADGEQFWVYAINQSIMEAE